MDRVLKRVGLSSSSKSGHQQQQQGKKSVVADEESFKLRRRRRSKSRRRSSAGQEDLNKSSKNKRGLFNIDWESVKDCRSCKSRAITRRFCSKRSDNELYRSNSFKFERFVRGTEETYTLGKKIALCDDYSLPVDNVGKRRPNSIAIPVLDEWIVTSPDNEIKKIEVLETYSTPRDSRHQIIQVEDVETKCFTSPDRDYSQPYTTEGSEEGTSDDEIFGHRLSLVTQELNSPDSITEEAAIVNTLDSINVTEREIKRHPSPYYYSDIFKNKNQQEEKSEKCDNHNKCSNNKKKKKKKCLTKGDGSHVRRRSQATSPLKILRHHSNGDEMTRQRHVYETAFDCRISKSDDDLDEIDKVTNHPVLVQWNQKVQNACDIAEKLQDMHLVQTPPSTAPLPSKFHDDDSSKEIITIRSTPNLPTKSRSGNTTKSLKAHQSDDPLNTMRNLRNPFDVEFGHSKRLISEIKGRPEKTDSGQLKRVAKGRVKEHQNNGIVEFKGRRRRKYSSTESMTTSSSSMESIKSSTSEGNRSTTSSESRQSSSLSSHSSDSGGRSLITQNTCFVSSAHVHTNNKLHILSPISDKSSQEPMSETSDNIRNNNSHKNSPGEDKDDLLAVDSTQLKTTKRRLPHNKNLLNLGAEIQGSDSGISIQSRFVTSSSDNVPSEDLQDLPFDMPKLRRRRQDVCCTSGGSATSVDLRDLPFDMPKLRRRLRQPEMSVSQASSSQSVACEDPRSTFRPKLTLNLSGVEIVRRQKPSLELSLGFVPVPSSDRHLISDMDVNLPLEKQRWFHGAITRVEAENVLKMLREGSFLVRNSESTKQDYSLSLKSARGFMHMRIQRCDVNDECSYILGQFSKPFHSIPEMIRHFCINRLPIRGAEHMCLLQPVIAQLL